MWKKTKKRLSLAEKKVFSALEIAHERESREYLRLSLAHTCAGSSFLSLKNLQQLGAEMLHAPTKKNIQLVINQLGAKWRVEERQVEIIRQILRAFKTTDDVILEAPTGSGKSLIGVAVAKFFETAYIATAEKVLQDQYADDFQCDIIKGADNYGCHQFFGATVAGAPCKADAQFRKHCGATCAYYQLRELAKTSPLLLSNYPYFAIEFDFVKQFPRKSIAIFDEAHNAEGILSEYAAVSLTTSVFQLISELEASLRAYTRKSTHSALVRKSLLLAKKLMKTPPPVGFRNGIEEAQRALPLFQKFYTKLSEISKNLTTELANTIAQLDLKNLSEKDRASLLDSGTLTVLRSVWTIDRLHCKWSNYLENAELPWILDAADEGLRLIPEHSAYYSRKLFQTMGEKRLWMSATLGHIPSFIRAHGLRQPTVHQLDSTFPEENRKVFLMSRRRINHQFVSNPDCVKQLASQVAQLLREHSTENGIIHSGSYALTRAIVPHLLRELADDRRLLHIPQNAQERTASLRAFLSEGGVIISPSMMQGLNLFGDTSRFQIVLKVPFLAITAALVEHKFKTDTDWYLNKAAIQIVQAAGRSVRSETDFAVTYILDYSATMLEDYFPKWFQLDLSRLPAAVAVNEAFRRRLETVPVLTLSTKNNELALLPR